MWSALSKLFGRNSNGNSASSDGISAAAATTKEEKEELGLEREWKEFEGRVTSLHSSYGLIDYEIYFVPDVVSGGSMPRVGEKVSVKASRKHKFGGWRAELVSRNIATESWDEDHDDDWDDEDEEQEKIEGEEFEKPDDALRMKSRQIRQKREAEAAFLDDLTSDKMGICITKPLSFGQLEIGNTESLKLEIRNDGDVAQTILGWSFHTPSVHSQLELSPLRLLSIDLKDSSRKAQETLPITLEPGKVAVTTVYCSSRYLGSDKQIVVFEFDGFAIGRQIDVTVLDPTQLDLQPAAPFQKSQAVGRYQQTKEAWIVPGQKPTWSRAGAKLPKRMALYTVPELLRKCIMEKRDITSCLPVLNQILSADNYARRFSALLHLEDIQQEIDIREFDLTSENMRVVGEFLALTVIGLAEGRPSLIIGDRAILSETDESLMAPSYEGVIHEVLCNEILLKFCEEFHSSYDGKEHNVRFMFSRTNVRRCHMAVEFVSKLTNGILFPKCVEPKAPQTQTRASRSVLAAVVKAGPVFGINKCPARPRVREIYAGHTFFNYLLNSRQRSAVFRVLQGQSRPTPYIIFGPPGTGKTVTVVECILQIFYHVSSCCILACTPSNSAADLLAERLHQSGLIHVSDMIRLNAFQRGSENVPESVKPYCADVDDVSILRTKRIVICTCSVAGMFYGLDLSPSHFTHVFVDEAGQATEPECMIPVGLVAASNGQIILAGDPLQLGPVLRSNLAKDYGLELSYLERLSKMPIYVRNALKFVSHGSYDPLLVTKLVENYRSHPALLNLSSELFYDGELVISADKCLVECLCSWEHLPNKNGFPILFHGIRGEDLREGNSPSWFNPQEAVQVMKYLQSVVHNDMYRLTYDDVGIITPYRKQVEKIRLLIDRLGMERVKVGSVEEFQGQERLVMIISTVRSTESLMSVDLRYTLGFLSNPKRFNVSITRAHALLIIIGNPHVLCQDFYWSKLLEYCVANNAYMGCDLPAGFGGKSLPRGTAEETEKFVESTELVKRGIEEEKEPAAAPEIEERFPTTVTSNSIDVNAESAHAACGLESDNNALVLDASKNRDELVTVSSEESRKASERAAVNTCVKKSSNLANDDLIIDERRDFMASKTELCDAAAALSQKSINCGLSDDNLSKTDVGSDVESSNVASAAVVELKDAVASEFGSTISIMDHPASSQSHLKTDEVAVANKDFRFHDQTDNSVSTLPCLRNDCGDNSNTGELDLSLLDCTKDSITGYHKNEYCISDGRRVDDTLVGNKDGGDSETVDAEVVLARSMVDEILRISTQKINGSRLDIEFSKPSDDAENSHLQGSCGLKTGQYSHSEANCFAGDVMYFTGNADTNSNNTNITNNVVDSSISGGANSVDEANNVAKNVTSEFKLHTSILSMSKPDIIPVENSTTGDGCLANDTSLSEAEDLSGRNSCSQVSTQSFLSNELDFAIAFDGDTTFPSDSLNSEEFNASFTDHGKFGDLGGNVGSLNFTEQISEASFFSQEPSNVEHLCLKHGLNSEFADDVFQHDKLNLGFSVDEIPTHEPALPTDVSLMDMSDVLPEYSVVRGEEENENANVRYGDFGYSVDAKSCIEAGVTDTLLRSCSEEADVCDGDARNQLMSSCISDHPQLCYVSLSDSGSETLPRRSGKRIAPDDSSLVSGVITRIKTNEEKEELVSNSEILTDLAEIQKMNSSSSKSRRGFMHSRHESGEGSASRGSNYCRTVSNSRYSRPYRRGGLHNTSFDSVKPSFEGREVSKHSPEDLNRQGFRKTDFSTKLHQKENIDYNTLPFLMPDAAEDLRKSPEQVFGAFKSAPLLPESFEDKQVEDEQLLNQKNSNNFKEGEVPVSGGMEELDQQMLSEFSFHKMVEGKLGRKFNSEQEKDNSTYLLTPESILCQDSSSQSFFEQFSCEAPMLKGMRDFAVDGGEQLSSIGKLSCPEKEEFIQVQNVLPLPHKNDDDDDDKVENCKPPLTGGQNKINEELIDEAPSKNSKVNRSVIHKVEGKMEPTNKPVEEEEDYGLLSIEQDQTEDLAKKIIHQMEYYFGDFNLMRDAFLQDQMKRDPDGWVQLSVIVTFNRMKTLATEFSVICDALRKSNAGIIEISEDGTKVRRSVEKPLNTDMESWLKDLKTRSVVIRKFPYSESIENMQSFFEKFGAVAHIERGIGKRSFHVSHHRSRGGIEHVDLVIFVSQDGVKNVAKRRYTTLKRMGLSATFEDDITDQCVEYFYKRRVQGIPKYSLSPVGLKGFADGDRKKEEDGLGPGSAPHTGRTQPFRRFQRFTDKENSAAMDYAEDSSRTRKSTSDADVGDYPLIENHKALHGLSVMHSSSETALEEGAAHQMTGRRFSSRGFSRGSWRGGCRSQSESFDRQSLSDPRPRMMNSQGRPQRNYRGGSARNLDIDRLLLDADNMSFSKQGSSSPGQCSSDSFESSPRVMIDSNSKTREGRRQVGNDEMEFVPKPKRIEQYGQSNPSDEPKLNLLDTSSKWPSTGSRRVKCFVPEACSELGARASGSSSFAARPAVGRVDWKPPMREISLSSPNGTIPGMSLNSLRTDVELDRSDVHITPSRPPARFFPTDRSAIDAEPEKTTPEKKKDYDDDEYPLSLDQRDDDIIIESSCEEVLEEDEEEEPGKDLVNTGWE